MFVENFFTGRTWCCILGVMVFTYGLYIYLPVPFHLNRPLVSVTRDIFLSQALADAGRFRSSKIWEYRMELPQLVTDNLRKKSELGEPTEAPQGRGQCPHSQHLSVGVGGVGAHSRFWDGAFRTRHCLVLGRLSVATGHVYSLHLTVMSVTCSRLGLKFWILEIPLRLSFFIFSEMKFA